MSLTQTTTTRVEALQHRLQPAAGAPALQQVRLRVAASTPAPTVTAPTAPTAPLPTLTRRFSFVWPFISKEHAADQEPFLKSRCGQLLRHFITAGSNESTKSVRDLISRVLTQLKTFWLVLAVYMSLAVLLGLCSTVLYTLLLAAKPPGLIFLVACVAATGAIAGVSFNAKARPQQRPQQPQQQVQPGAQPPSATLQVPKLTVN